MIAALLPTGRAADIWFAGLRLPNVLQNLLGEGTLSASFIPIYARWLEEGREEDARRFAGAILGILLVVAYGGALVGIAAAPWIAAFVALGPAVVLESIGFDAVRWTPEEIALLATVLRILFPMTATLVVSAWALGVLNSHRRFFLSYVAPVLWNVAIIAAASLALARYGPVSGLGIDGAHLPLKAIAFGALAGGVLQLAVQLPAVLELLGGVRLSLGRGVAGVREAIRNFGPVVLARGVVNVSALVDVALAAALTAGAISLIGRAQVFYLLPISLFGMAVAASELPELSRSGPSAGEAVAHRVRDALRRVRWFLIPSAVAYVLFGDLLISGLFERGGFGPDDARAAGWVLAAYALGLPASGASRTLSSAFYALRDTRTPARIAVLRVALSLATGASLMLPFDRLSVGALGLGAVGLALGATAGAWLEYGLLRRALRGRVGPHGPGGSGAAAIFAAALLAGAVAFGARTLGADAFASLADGLARIPVIGASRVDRLVLAAGISALFGGTYLLVSRILPGAARPRGARGGVGSDGEGSGA